VKVGVFICHCGKNIAGVIDIERVLEEIKKDPDIFIIDNQYTCSEPGLNELKSLVKDENLDRIVIAACSPKMHEKLFRDTLEQAGKNPYLLEIANIREQDSWVHRTSPKKATYKAIDLIKMAIEKAKFLYPLKKQKIPVKQAVLVLGGGIGGIKAALTIADLGVKVYLIEKEPSIGGHMAMYDKTFPTLDCSICILAPLMVEVSHHDNIEIMTNAELAELSGNIGNFKAKILKKAWFVNEKCTSGCIEDCATNCPIEVQDEFNQFGSRKAIYIQFPQAIPLKAAIDKEACIGCRNCELFCKRDAINYEDKDSFVELEVGAIINAIGFDPYDPTPLSEYGYGKYPNVITGLEMERILTASGPTDGKLLRPSDGKPIKRVTFIQCVGSRDEKIGRELCSRVCCMYSMKQALQIKEQNPEAEINVLYVDVRASGKGYEEFYNRVRDERVRFIKGRASRIIEKTGTNDLKIRTEDALMGRQLEIESDLVILAIGIQAPKDADKIASILNISRTADGFFQESHPKLRPAESITPGIYLAGCIQGPKDIQNTVNHAALAATIAATVTLKKEIEVEPIAPIIDREKCIKCKLCTKVCDFGAIEFVNDQIEIYPAACVGCGVCTGACPSEALEIPGFSPTQILAEVRSIKEKLEFPLIIGFFCNWCAYSAADLAGTSKIEYPTNIRVIRLNCTGSLSPKYVIEAFQHGADGVLIAGCHEQTCHYTTGFTHAAQRYEVISEFMEQANINKKRLRIESVSAAESQKIKSVIEDYSKELEELGPLGMEFDGRLIK